MEKVKLADQLGNTTYKKVGFSFFHLFFGPFYLISRGKIISALLEIILFYYLLPFPGMDLLTNLILSHFNNIFTQIICYILLFFRKGKKYIILGALILTFIHFIYSSRVSSLSVRHFMKRKQYLPVDEVDARNLIKYHVCDVNVKLADSFNIFNSKKVKSVEDDWYENNQKSIDSHISFPKNSRTFYTSEEQIKIKKEQFSNALNLGIISNDEYEKNIKELEDNSKK